MARTSPVVSGKTTTYAKLGELLCLSEDGARLRYLKILGGKPEGGRVTMQDLRALDRGRKVREVRDRKIANALRAGKTVREVGKTHKLSARRIQQLTVQRAMPVIKE